MLCCVDLRTGTVAMIRLVWRATWSFVLLVWIAPVFGADRAEPWTSFGLVGSVRKLTGFFLTSRLWATAQRNQAKQSRFINFENSPVALEELGNSHQVRNASSKTVVKFTLACLITPNGKPSTVLLKFPAKETDIAPGDASGEIRLDSPSSSEICAARKAKLAVIDVTFSDASQWLAPVERKSPKSVGDGSSDYTYDTPRRGMMQRRP
jgi:hypothetical protein